MCPRPGNGRGFFGDYPSGTAVYNPDKSMRSIRLIQATVIVSATFGASCAPPADHTAELAAHAADVFLPADVPLVPAEILISSRVLPGTTMASLLRAHRIAEAEVAELIARASAIFDLRRVRVDQPYRFARALDGALRWF